MGVVIFGCSRCGSAPISLSGTQWSAAILLSELCSLINRLEEECLPRTRGFTLLVGIVLVRNRVSPPYAGVHHATGPWAGMGRCVSPVRGGSPFWDIWHKGSRRCLPRTRGFTGDRAIAGPLQRV